MADLLTAQNVIERRNVSLQSTRSPFLTQHNAKRSQGAIKHPRKRVAGGGNNTTEPIIYAKRRPYLKVRGPGLKPQRGRVGKPRFDQMIDLGTY